MVDAAANFEHFGVTEQVTAKKAREQAIAAPGQMKQLGIVGPAELFTKLGELFGCARWVVSETPGGGVEAQTATCLACAIAKRRGGGRPCDLYCINPFKGFAAALSPQHELTVHETLWDGGRCRFQVLPK
jgi:hypothetical protein